MQVKACKLVSLSRKNMQDRIAGTAALVLFQWAKPQICSIQ
jgi:hypothetical protein